MLTKAQIGKCGELLVQYKLLQYGIESSQLTTDTGIDLVAYSARTKRPVTIQVKANLKPKPGGGKGKMALDWWIPQDSPAQVIALVDLSTDRVWLLKMSEVTKLAQQKPKGRYHLYMYTDPTTKPRTKYKRVLAYQFEKYLLDNRVHRLF